MSENSMGAFKIFFKKFRESILGSAALLGAITLVMGLVLALVNSLTAPEIAKRLREEKEESIKGFFGGEVEFEYVELDFAAPVRDAVYVRSATSKRLAGYCVTVAPRGFSGDIVMLVAVNANITVRGVKILEMSESAGIGTKIESEDWFAEQFRFKSRDIAVVSPYGRPGDNAIDTVAGATKSSKAFLAGVNAALEAAHRIRTAEAPTTTEETEEPEEEFENFGEFEDIEEGGIIDG